MTTKMIEGPRLNQIFRRGMRVRIKAGAVIFSTHPQIPREGKTITRARVVKVHHTVEGYEGDRYGSHARDPQIEWVGTGSYWFWTHSKYVEILEDPDSTAPGSQSAVPT